MGAILPINMDVRQTIIDCMKLAFEIVGVEATLNISPVTRYIPNRRWDWDILPILDYRISASNSGCLSSSLSNSTVDLCGCVLPRS